MRTTCFKSRYSQVKNCPKPYQFRAIEEALVEAMSLQDDRGAQKLV